MGDRSKPIRSSVGGYPTLPEDQEWPKCRICGEKQVLFFQFDILEEFKLPFKAGSHLSVFMCINHDNPIKPPLWPNSSGQLPLNYWEYTAEGNEGHYKLVLNPPGIKERTFDIETRMIYSSVTFEKSRDRVKTCGPANNRIKIGLQEFKVSGIPSWAQDPEQYFCCCGAEMKFICQVPQDFVFPKAKDAPSQPSTWSDKKYNLFLGNETYIFACAAQCNPLAVWPITQCD